MRRGRSGGRWCPGSQGRFFAAAPWCQQPAPRCRGGRRAGSAGLLGPRRPECQQRASGEVPSAARVELCSWPLTHPRRSPPPERDALCLGSLASSGSDPVLLIQQAQVQPQLGKIPQATWHGQKKFKKERKRNACYLHSPSLSMRQPAPSPRNVVGAVGAHQTWSCPMGSPSVKLPLTVPQKSGAVEQRSLLLVLWLQVTRCDPVPTQGGEEAVQTGFWGAVGSEPNGRQLPPSILTRALWGGSQARGPTGRNTPCVPALPRQGRGSLDPRPVLLQRHPRGTGKKGAAKAGTGQAGGTAVPLPSPSAFAGGCCRVGPAPAHLQTLCPIPSPGPFLPLPLRPPSPTCVLRGPTPPRALSQRAPGPQAASQPDFQHLAPKEHVRQRAAALPTCPGLWGGFANAQQH